MSYSDEDLFIDKEIRDTNDHDSKIAYVAEAIPKTITLVNSHDAAIDIEVFGSRKTDPDNVHYKIFTLPITIPAGTPADPATDFITLTNYFPKILIHAKAQTQPTTGKLQSHLLVTS